MGTTTTTFALNKPTVGGDDNTWGTDWNTNADKLDDLLDGTTAIKPNLSEGLWKVGGVAVTATAAELNVLDGATLTVTELNYVDGVTSAIQTQLDAKQASDAELTAIAGLASNGIIARTGAGTAAARTVTAGTGITVTNGDGVSGDPTVAATLASQAEAEAGTDNTKVMTPLRVAQAARPQLGTSVASTSGTAIDFTGIPSWVRRVTLLLTNVSTSGASNKLLQLGSGSIQNTGYVSSCMNCRNAGTGAGSVSTNGFTIDNDSLAAYAYDGCIKLYSYGGNTWLIDGLLGDTTGIRAPLSTGRVTLSGPLDRVRFTTAGGTDSYDSGAINIMWE